MFVQIEPTPNPGTLKFLPGQQVLQEGSLDVASVEEACVSPLAVALFKIRGVSGVFFGGDFISVSKEEEAQWKHLKPSILTAIVDHYASGVALLYDEGDRKSPHKVVGEGEGEENREIVEKIIELLDSKVRPAVARDGGDIVFHGYKDGCVYLHMQGACSGCPAASVTLKNGIENLLKYYIPEVKEVLPVE